MKQHIPTVKSAILWISLTTNIFLATLGYYFMTGQLQRIPKDYVTLLEERNKP